MGHPMVNHRYKAKAVVIDENKITGHKGWVTYLADIGSQCGNWYFEVQFSPEIKKLRFQGHKEVVVPKASLRVGWACRYQRYDSPLGVNDFSIAYSSLDGNCIRLTRNAYASKYEGNDVIGCYIHIPNEVPPLPDPRDDRRLYEFIQAGILCDPQSPPPSEIVPGSYVKFTLNGVDQGIASNNLPNGFYHPGVSLYMGAIAFINLGPDFKYDPGPEFLPCKDMQTPEIQ